MRRPVMDGYYFVGPRVFTVMGEFIAMGGKKYGANSEI